MKKDTLLTVLIIAGLIGGVLVGQFLLFQPDYIKRLMEIGEADGDRQAAEIGALIS